MKPHALVLAGSGAGKTVLAKNKLIPQAHNTGKTVIIVDVEDEYGDIADAVVEDASDIPDAVKAGHSIVRIVPEYKGYQNEHAGRALDRILFWCDKVKPCVVFVDEAHEFQTSAKVWSEYLSRVLKKGRKYGMTVVQLSQESTDINNSMFRNSGIMYCLNMNTPNSKIEDWLTDRDLEYLTEIPPYHYLVLYQNVWKDNKLCEPVEPVYT